MKKFTLTVDIAFKAEDLEDAAKKVAHHFERIAIECSDVEHPELPHEPEWFVGGIDLHGVKK